MRNKTQNILSYLKEINSDIAGLQETWLNEGDKSILNEIKECNYEFIKMSRKTKMIGGGLLVIYKSQLKIQKVVLKDAVKFETFEHLTCKITTSNAPVDKTIVLVNIYSKPYSSEHRCTPKMFLNEFESFLTILTTSYN